MFCPYGVPISTDLLAVALEEGLFPNQADREEVNDGVVQFILQFRLP